MNDFYFFIDLEYDKSLLIEKIRKLEEFKDSWSTYGPKSKKTLWAHPLDINDNSIHELTSKFKPGVIDDVMILMTRKFGSVYPHIDSRASSLLLPISGDFDVSSVEFYNSSNSSGRVDVNNHTGKLAGDAVNFEVGNPDCSISYSTPILINTKKIHAVKNPSPLNRYVLSMSILSSVSFSELVGMFGDNKILRD